MGGGTGNGGAMTGEHLRVSGDKATKAISNKERAKTIGKKLAFLSLPIAIATSAVVANDAWTDKNARISSLENTVEEKETMLNAAVTLGSSGVRFADVRIIEDSVIVEVPGTTTNCQTINFDYSNTAEGWTLSLEQVDAAGRTYDNPKAHSAQGVTALVEDLCS